MSRNKLRGSALALGTLAAAIAQAQAPDFSHAPATVAGRPPVPNVIVEVDAAARHPAHLAGLKSALREAFAAPNAPTGSMRLAWQASGDCSSLPDTGPLCQGRNALRVLDEAQRLAFMAFIDRLGGVDVIEAAQAPAMVEAARTYLRRPGVDPDSPWSAIPGTQAAPWLSCRKAALLLVAPGSGGSGTPPVTTAWPDPAVYATRDEAPAIRDTLARLLADSEAVRPSVVASSMTRGAMADGKVMFAARYDSTRWSGDVAAFTIAQDDAAPPAPLWGIQPASMLPHTSASLLDARDPESRVMLSSRGSGAQWIGTAWRWAQLDTDEQDALDDGDGQGPQRLPYLRGERAGEAAQGGPFRDRTSRQADAVNSGLWFAASRPASGATPARTAMLYVGSNGGVLHGFDAASGAERLAYVPQGAHAGLARLTRPGYTHRYTVDGSPFTAEVPDSAGVRTWLAGFLGAGGKGYFVLDASDPAAFSEANAQRLVVLDTTARSDPDFGHIVSEPVRERGDPGVTRQITRLNDGRVALVTGNGYGSTQQKAVLLIQYLDGARELLKLPAGEAGDGNGLSAPRLVDLDGDQRPDLAYAGDLRGQLWKFDLRGSKAGAWQVAFGGRPLYVAQDAAGTRQPITSAPLWMAHPRGGLMLVFGTGRLLSERDRAATATQSVYGIHDAALGSTDAQPVPAGRSALVQQTIAAEPVGTVAGRSAWRSSAHAVPDGGPDARRGWYLDLPVAGERVLRNPTGFEGKLVDIVSSAPPLLLSRTADGDLAESCDAPQERHYLTTLNAIDGTRPTSQLYGALDASRIELGADAPAVTLKQSDTERRIAPDGSTALERRRLNHVARRPAWYHLR